MVTVMQGLDVVEMQVGKRDGRGIPQETPKPDFRQLTIAARAYKYPPREDEPKEVVNHNHDGGTMNGSQEVRFPDESLRAVKEYLPAPLGLLEAVASTTLDEQPEGSDLYKKAWRLQEIVYLCDSSFSIQPYKEEATQLLNELLWQVGVFNSRSSSHPAWPDGLEYQNFGLA